MDKSDLDKKNARTSGEYDKIWQTTGKCVFCDLKDKYILHEENGVVLTINIYPYIDGQMMAIPRRHVNTSNELSQLEWETMRKFGYIARKLFKKVHKSKAMWSVIKTGLDAQATVADHLHMHFIPFDNPDLCKWNYRDLKFSPLENIDLYKQNIPQIKDSLTKFDQKYKQTSSLQVSSDLIIFNAKKEILLTERRKEFKFTPDYLCLPGGHVNDPSNGLVNELCREVKEEINYEADIKDIELVDSRIGNVKYQNPSKYLNTNLERNHQFVWNTYLLRTAINSVVDLKPGDDCERIIWINLNDIVNAKNISKESKQVIIKGYKLLYRA
jgi:diadenosine tetraphosphate (Ap4A) HIT family hydrolase/8-oxo-dGTP pyrophosphatase MutT (NUDIX family)